MRSTADIIQACLWRARKACLNLTDFRNNLQAVRSQPHLLFLREHYAGEDYNHYFLKWIRTRHPGLSKRIRLTRLADVNPVTKHTALYVPWLHNFKKDVTPENYHRALAIEEYCAQKGIPVVNPLASLENIFKSNALKIMASAGVRTAKAVQVEKTSAQDFDPERTGIGYPFFVREDYLHNAKVHLVREKRELAAIPWKVFRCPVAVEFIDVKGKDGLFRKYRYVMAGDEGAPRHLVASRNWYVHVKDRILEEKFQDEEVEYLKLERDPNHDRLNAARKALGLDIVTFDYSYTPDGEPVVWEPNAAAAYWTKANDLQYFQYHREPVERIYQMILDYYLKRAGLKE